MEAGDGMDERTTPCCQPGLLRANIITSFYLEFSPLCSTSIL